MADEITLTMLLDQSNKTKENVELSINEVNKCILIVNQMIQDVDLLIVDVKNNDDKYELMQYKSLILQTKANHQNQLVELENIKKQVKHNISVIEKVIQLNTGDIF